MFSRFIAWLFGSSNGQKDAHTEGAKARDSDAVMTKDTAIAQRDAYLKATTAPFSPGDYRPLLSARPRTEPIEKKTPKELWAGSGSFSAGGNGGLASFPSRYKTPVQATQPTRVDHQDSGPGLGLFAATLLMSGSASSSTHGRPRDEPTRPTPDPDPPSRSESHTAVTHDRAPSYDSSPSYDSGSSSSSSSSSSDSGSSGSSE